MSAEAVTTAVTVPAEPRVASDFDPDLELDEDPLAAVPVFVFVDVDAAQVESSKDSAVVVGHARLSVSSASHVMSESAGQSSGQVGNVVRSDVNLDMDFWSEMTVALYCSARLS